MCDKDPESKKFIEHTRSYNTLFRLPPWESKYSIVFLVARWPRPALSPYCEQSSKSRVFVSRFILAEGGSEVERFACATGASAQMESWLSCALCELVKFHHLL